MTVVVYKLGNIRDLNAQTSNRRSEMSTQKVYRLVRLSTNGLIGDGVGGVSWKWHQGTYQTFEMFHEYLQANIIRKDRLPSTASLTRAIHSS